MLYLLLTYFKTWKIYLITMMPSNAILNLSSIKSSLDVPNALSPSLYFNCKRKEKSHSLLKAFWKRPKIILGANLKILFSKGNETIRKNPSISQVWNPKHLSVLYNLVDKGHESANMLCENSRDIFKHISITRSVERKWLTAVCRMPVDFPSDSCSFRNKYSPCTGRKCCGFTILSTSSCKNMYFIYFLLAWNVKQKMHRNHIKWHITWMSKLKRHQKKLTSLKRLDHSCMWILKISLSGYQGFTCYKFLKNYSYFQ